LLVFPYEESIAQIIDGQHRMSGFEDDFKIDFDLPITIFIDQSVEQQAEIFSTINGKQTRVTPSLVYELFGINERPSPYKTAHNIVVALNNSEESPLKNWFKRLGKSNKYYEGFITQSTANQNILKILCGNAKQVDEDMRVLSRGEKLSMETKFSISSWFKISWRSSFESMIRWPTFLSLPAYPGRVNAIARVPFSAAAANHVPQETIDVGVP
jgi:DGQHR domain-containing protein